MEAILLFRTYSKLAILALIASSQMFANVPYGRDSYRDKDISNINSSMPGTDPACKPPSCPDTAFIQQGFILWDYLVDVHSDEALVAHFLELTALCKKSKFKQVIVYIFSPQDSHGATVFDFFQVNSGMTQNFRSMIGDLVATMRNEEGVEEFFVSMLFDSSEFNSDAPVGTFISPYSAIEAPALKAGYFPSLDKMMDYAAYMINSDMGIESFGFDPEATGAKDVDYQDLYNLVDNYRWAYGMIYTPSGGGNKVPAGIFSTHGVDMSKITYANVFEFPVNNALVYSFKSVFPNPQPSWRKENQYMTAEGLKQPMLKQVLIQVYEENIPAMFNVKTADGCGYDGPTAAKYCNSMLRDVPYLKGVGKIWGDRNSGTLNGDGTNFNLYTGQDGFIFKDELPLKKIGIMGSVNSATSMSLEFGPTISIPEASAIPFQTTEVTGGWPFQPGMTQDGSNRIYWMFSLNCTSPLNFFGNWNLCDFMSFISNFQKENQENSPFPGYTIPDGNIALYDFHFLESSVNTCPSPPWNIGPVLNFD